MQILSLHQKETSDYIKKGKQLAAAATEHKCVLLSLASVDGPNPWMHVVCGACVGSIGSTVFIEQKASHSDHSHRQFMICIDATFAARVIVLNNKRSAP